MEINELVNGQTIDNQKGQIFFKNRVLKLIIPSQD